MYISLYVHFPCHQPNNLFHYLLELFYKIQFLSFFLRKSKKYINENKLYNFNRRIALNFNEINLSNYPIYNIFKQINKNNPADFIKFNISNEFAIELFKKNKILFGDIHKIIDKSLSINLNSSLNSIQKIINYHKQFNNLLINTNEHL